MEKIASRKEFWGGLTLAGWIGIGLAMGFQPVALSLWTEICRVLGLNAAAYSLVAFPALALLFHLSLPRRGSQKPTDSFAWSLVAISILPLLISFLFGALKPEWPTGSGALSGQDWIWICLAVPLGEELLFRGWLYRFLDRFAKGASLTVTNPLPVAVWGTALAFSLWHFQNWGVASAPWVIFQILYTFWTGVWLGVLRWRTGSLWVPILAHALINLLAEWRSFPSLNLLK